LVGVTVWAHWLTGNRSDAEDVAQEASLRAIRGFAGGSARAWVLSIVRNTAYSWLHPAAVVTVEDLEAVEAAHVEPGDPDAGTPEAALIAKDRRRTTARCNRGAADAVPRDAGAARHRRS
jgi:RNA polymerase sigma-70 factor (ECF subfamily)